MKTSTTIAIIGATDSAGQAMLKRLLHTDSHLLLLATDQHELRMISKILKNEKPVAGISLVDCIKDGCWEADVVILAVPEEREKEVAARIRDVVTQKIVISMKIADAIPGNSLKGMLPNSSLVYANFQVNGSEEVLHLTSESSKACAEVANLFNEAIKVSSSIAA